MNQNANQTIVCSNNFRDPCSSNQQHRVQRTKVYQHILSANDPRSTEILLCKQQPRPDTELNRTSTTRVTFRSNQQHVSNKIKIQRRQTAVRPNICTGSKGEEQAIPNTEHGSLECTNRQNRNALNLDSDSLERLRTALAKVSITPLLSPKEEKEKQQKDALCKDISKRLDLLAKVQFSVRIVEPLTIVYISGPITNPDDLDFLFRFRAQKKLEPFSCIDAVIDLSDLQITCDLSGFLSRWALFILSRCTSFAVINPRDATTSETVRVAIECFNSNPDAQPIQILSRPIKISITEQTE